MTIKKWKTLWQKEKLHVLCNFLFCHYVFKKPTAAEASESVYMRERVKPHSTVLQLHHSKSMVNHEIGAICNLILRTSSSVLVLSHYHRTAGKFILTISSSVVMLSQYNRTVGKFILTISSSVLVLSQYNRTAGNVYIDNKLISCNAIPI